MNKARKVIGSKSLFFLEAAAVSVPAAGTGSVAGPASASNKPDVTDPLYIDIGPIKWNSAPGGKTEKYMSPAGGGAYVVEDEIPLSRGKTLKGKLEKMSNLFVALRDSATIPSSGVGGVYNPLSAAPNVRGWLHIEERDQNNTLVNTVEVWVSLRASGDTNMDDKATETPVEAEVLYSTLAVGNLS